MSFGNLTGTGAARPISSMIGKIAMLHWLLSAHVMPSRWRSWSSSWKYLPGIEDVAIGGLPGFGSRHEGLAGKRTVDNDKPPVRKE
jgi:hypothetical protein